MANLDKYNPALARAKEAALKLEVDEEHEEDLGENLAAAESAVRIGIMAAIQAELGHGYIVSLCTNNNGANSKIRVKKATF